MAFLSYSPPLHPPVSALDPNQSGSPSYRGCARVAPGAWGRTRSDNSQPAVNDGWIRELSSHQDRLLHPRFAGRWLLMALLL